MKNICYYKEMDPLTTFYIYTFVKGLGKRKKRRIIDKLFISIPIIKDGRLVGFKSEYSYVKLRNIINNKERIK